MSTTNYSFILFLAFVLLTPNSAAVFLGHVAPTVGRTKPIPDNANQHFIIGVLPADLVYTDIFNIPQRKPAIGGVFRYELVDEYQAWAKTPIKYEIHNVVRTAIVGKGFVSVTNLQALIQRIIKGITNVIRNILINLEENDVIEFETSSTTQLYLSLEGYDETLQLPSSIRFTSEGNYTYQIFELDTGDRVQNGTIIVTRTNPINQGSGANDPEYTTLDGLRIVYDGPCQYLLSSNECTTSSNIDGDSFSIISRHGRARSRTKHVVVITAFLIQINTNNIMLSRESDIYVNNNAVDCSLNDSVTIDEIRYSKQLYQVKGTVEERILITTNFGLEIVASLNDIGKIWIKVPTNIRTCGLLGNNNNNKYDDLQLKNGTVLYGINADNVNIMGDSWYVPYDEEPLQCKLHPYDSYSAYHNCKHLDSIKYMCDIMVKTNLKKLTGRKIEKCFNTSDVITQTRIYDDCISELCYCEETQGGNCRPQLYIQQFNQICSQAQIHFEPIIF